MKRVLIVAALLASACGSSPTAPAPTTTTTTIQPPSFLSGTWNGYAEEKGVPIAGSTIGTITALRAHIGASVTGTWSASYANPAANSGGSLSGTVIGTSITMTLQPTVRTQCPLNVTATYTSATLVPIYIQGTYAAFNCSLPSNGTIILQNRPL